MIDLTEMEERAGAAASLPGQVVLRRVLLGASVVAALLLLAHLGVAFWAANELNLPESIVAVQSVMLARDGTLYYELDRYPYTVCAYMPAFYVTVAGLHKLGLPVLIASRAISCLSMIGILWLVWKVVLLYSGDRFCAWMGAVLAGGTELVLGWGIVGQVDTLAICLTLAAFYQYSRYRVLGEETVLRAALFALAALLTKQTVVSAPAAIFVLLLMERPKKAVQFAAIVAGVGGALVLALNAALDGRFLENTVFANMNPLAWRKLSQHWNYASVALSPLLLVVLLGAGKAWRGRAAAPLLYLAFSVFVVLMTAGKVGSDSNYQIEAALLLVICACLALHSLEFNSLFFRQSKTWVTLLILPVGIYFVNNVRIASFCLVVRVARENQMTMQVRELRPYLQGNGRVLSADINALLHTRGHIEVEPIIYRLLVQAKRIDAEPLRRDLAAGAFETVLLNHNVSRVLDTPASETPRHPLRAPEPGVDPEIPGWTESQMDALRERYRLIRRVGAVYVYQPRPEPAI